MSNSLKFRWELFKQQGVMIAKEEKLSFEYFWLSSATLSGLDIQYKRFYPNIINRRIMSFPLMRLGSQVIRRIGSFNYGILSKEIGDEVVSSDNRMRRWYAPLSQLNTSIVNNVKDYNLPQRIVYGLAYDIGEHIIKPIYRSLLRVIDTLGNLGMVSILVIPAIVSYVGLIGMYILGMKNTTPLKTIARNFESNLAGLVANPLIILGFLTVPFVQLAIRIVTTPFVSLANVIMNQFFQSDNKYKSVSNFKLQEAWVGKQAGQSNSLDDRNSFESIESHSLDDRNSFESNIVGIGNSLYEDYLDQEAFEFEESEIEERDSRPSGTPATDGMFAKTAKQTDGANLDEENSKVRKSSSCIIL